MSSRGNCITAYSAPFARGAKVFGAQIQSGAVTSAKIKAAFLSGTLVSGLVTYPIAHGLGAVPKFALVCAIATAGQISANHDSVSIAAASAATSTNVYLRGGNLTATAIKYSLYVQL